MLVLQVDLFEVLSWLVQVVESQNFIVSYFDFGGKVLSELLFRSKTMLKLLDGVVVSLASFISLSYFLRPLILINKDSVLDLKPAKCCIYRRWSILALLLEEVSHFHALFVALQDIC